MPPSLKKQRRIQASTPPKNALTRGTGSTPTPFQIQMEQLKVASYLKLNDEGAKLLNELKRNPNNGDAVNRLMNAYVRAAQLIDFSYESATQYRGKVIGMGNNEGAQLFPQSITEGNDNQDNSSIPPSIISLLLCDVRAVSAGGLHSIALSTNGTPYTWGISDNGALGRVISDSIEEGQPSLVTGFETTDPHQRNNRICEDGQINQISAGNSHSLFLSINGNVYHCGAYINDGKPYSVDDSKKVVNGATKKKEPLFGANMEPVHVYQIPQKAIAVAAGNDFSAAILEDSTLVTWGEYFVCIIYFFAITY